MKINFLWCNCIACLRLLLFGILVWQVIKNSWQDLQLSSNLFDAIVITKIMIFLLGFSVWYNFNMVLFDTQALENQNCKHKWWNKIPSGRMWNFCIIFTWNQRKCWAIILHVPSDVQYYCSTPLTIKFCTIFTWNQFHDFFPRQLSLILPIELWKLLDIIFII